METKLLFSYPSPSRKEHFQISRSALILSLPQERHAAEQGLPERKGVLYASGKSRGRVIHVADFEPPFLQLQFCPLLLVFRHAR